MAKTCNNCKTDDMAVIPIAQHEKDQNRLMSIIKWLIAVIVVLIILAVGSNAFWIWKNSQYEIVEETTEEYEANAEDGGNAIINNDGSVSVNG